MTDAVIKVPAYAMPNQVSVQDAAARTRKLADWAMFSVGALSLTIAIGGTVLGNVAVSPSATAEVSTEITFTG